MKHFRIPRTSLLGIGTLVSLFALAIHVEADGWLDITNNINGSNSRSRIAHFPGFTDAGTDGNGEAVFIDPSLNKSGIYSETASPSPNDRLSADFRDTSSTIPFILKSVYNGTLSVPATNFLRLVFNGTNQFQHKPNLTMRLLDTNGIPTTNVWDLKNVIANQGGIIVLKNVPAGNYDSAHPASVFRVDFDPLIPNVIPSAQSSFAIGSKTEMIAGNFVVSDSDGTVTNVNVLSPPLGFSNTGTNWTYNPSGFSGTNIVSFYAVDDAGAFSTTNTLTLITTNRPPTAFSQSLTNLAETGTAIALSGADPDGDALLFSVGSSPAHGPLSGSGSNRVYNSTANYYGPDNFTFTVSDGEAVSSSATVSLLLLPSNRVPVISGISVVGTNVEVSAQVQPNRTTVPQQSNPLSSGWADLTALAQTPPMNTNLLQPAIFIVPLGTNSAGYFRLKSSSP